MQCYCSRMSVQAGTAAVRRASPLPVSPRCSAHRVTVLTSAGTARSVRACAPRSGGPRCSRSQAAPVPPGAGTLAPQPRARSRPASTELTLLTHRYLHQPAAASYVCTFLRDVSRARLAHQPLAAPASSGSFEALIISLRPRLPSTARLCSRTRTCQPCASKNAPLFCKVAAHLCGIRPLVWRRTSPPAPSLLATLCLRQATPSKVEAYMP